MEREESTGVRLKSMCRLIVVFYVNECELSDSMTFKGRAAFLSGTPLTLASHNQISWLSIVEVEIKGSVCCFSDRVPFSMPILTEGNVVGLTPQFRLDYIAILKVCCGRMRATH